MQVFISTSNPNTFKLNGLTYPKNFMIIKQGDTNIAVHNAYDTKFQLLGSTHYSEVQVNGVVHSSQANLMAALSILLFAKEFNYISQSNQATRLISVGNITVDGNYVTIDNAEWLINGISYETTDNTVLTVPFASTGLNRIDIIIADSLNQIIRIAGDETSGIAVAPVVPIDTVYITQISVNDNGIGEPEEPISGEYYITKAQEGVRYHSHSGVVNNIILGKETHNLLTGSITEIRGYNFALENLELYVGKRYLLVNNLGSDIIIRNDHPSGAFKFYLNNSQDLILKATQTVEFWFTNFGEFRQIDTIPTLQVVTDNNNVTTTLIEGNAGFKSSSAIDSFEFGTQYGSSSKQIAVDIQGNGVEFQTGETYSFSANLDDGFILNHQHLSANQYSNFEASTNKGFFSNKSANKVSSLTIQNGVASLNAEDHILLTATSGITLNTNNSYGATLDLDALTSGRTVAFPDKSGTIAFTSDITGSTGSSELEKISEGGNTGWALLGRTAANYGNIGSNAIDLSITTFANSTYGATGTYAFAAGHNNTASGEGSVAMCNGTKAANYGAFAAGTITTANGYVSSVFGEYNTANSYAETVIGHYATNITGTTNSIVANEPVFRIGVGADNSNRADGFRVYNNGSSYFKPFATSGVTGSQGYFGYNSTTNLMAFHNGTAWSDLSTKTYADTKIAKHTGTTYTTNAIVTLTQAEYNAISGSTDANTLYFII